jgi:Domain of unknown function (DUF3127)
VPKAVYLRRSISFFFGRSTVFEHLFNIKNMKAIGKLLEIQATQQVSDAFKKRVFILEHAENPQYPEYISFELIQDRCDLLDSFQPGQDIEVSFNLKGRKWVNPEGATKYFNTLQAWRIESVAPGSSQAPSAAHTSTNSMATTAANEEDDLPF